MTLNALILTAALAFQTLADRPSAPEQPLSGPGGSSYAHASVTKTSVGQGGKAFWLFEPAEPRPDSAPVVVFLHAIQATNPRTYGAWIDHLVRSGKTVIYPRYQSGVLPRVKTFLPNCKQALSDAFALLASAEHVSPQLNKVAMIGHSLGGRMAANLAASAKRDGLPQPSALFAAMPGSADFSQDTIELEDLSSIPSETLLLTLAAADDSISGESDARSIYLKSTAVSMKNKDFLLMHSDDHGLPRASRHPHCPHGHRRAL